MRGRGRTIASVLAESLSPRPEARLTAVAAAFAEACGRPLSRESAVRAVTRDGRVMVVARTGEWAEQLVALSEPICHQINARLGRPVVAALEVRVGPLR
jgi:predicted nucleic acid-binding Zn ribbon protein